MNRVCEQFLIKPPHSTDHNKYFNSIKLQFDTRSKTINSPAGSEYYCDTSNTIPASVSSPQGARRPLSVCFNIDDAEDNKV